MLCVDSFGGFSPFRADDCFNEAWFYYTPTTPESTSVTVAASGRTNVDFGGRRRESSTLTGIAILNDGYAPVGTTIDAWHNGAHCGSTQVEEPGGYGNITYSLEVYGAGENPGCPVEGEEFEIEVGGLPASERPMWHDTRVTGGNLTAMPNHAWYWTEQAVPSSPYEGEFVVAMVDGTVCGAAGVLQGSHLFETVFGFSKLIVPLDSISPGCGYPGAPIEFHLGEQVVTAVWEPGVHYLDLTLYTPVRRKWGDVDCDGAITTRDNQAELRYILEQEALSQGNGCARIGIRVPIDGTPRRWGDEDCDWQITTRDSQAKLRHVLGQSPLSRGMGCPGVGEDVETSFESPGQAPNRRPS